MTSCTVQSLIQQLMQITACTPTLLIGGKHGHAGIILKDTNYAKLSITLFTIPSHPGFYPTNASHGIKVQAKEEKGCKALIHTYKVCVGVV